LPLKIDALDPKDWLPLPDELPLLLSPGDDTDCDESESDEPLEEPEFELPDLLRTVAPPESEVCLILG